MTPKRFIRNARFVMPLLAVAAAAASAEDFPPTIPSDTTDDRGTDPAATAGVMAPFAERLSGTTLTFDMVPVEAGAVSVEVDGVTETVEVGPFWIARAETTWEFYDVFVFELDHPEGGTNGPTGADVITRPSKPYVAPDRGYGHQGYAVISVAYRGASQYCKWLSAKTGRHYRLPTEAEWKLVCAQSGLTPETLDDHAWCDENAEFSPHPVGTKAADALGLHDLWGNVREWCVGVDGEPVALGGSFIDFADDIGCGARAEFEPDWQMTDPQVPKSTWWLSDADFVGLRVLCAPAPKETPSEKQAPEPAPAPAAAHETEGDVHEPE